MRFSYSSLFCFSCTVAAPAARAVLLLLSLLLLVPRPHLRRVQISCSSLSCFSCTVAAPTARAALLFLSVLLLVHRDRACGACSSLAPLSPASRACGRSETSGVPLLTSSGVPCRSAASGSEIGGVPLLTCYAAPQPLARGRRRPFFFPSWGRAVPLNTVEKAAPVLWTVHAGGVRTVWTVGCWPWGTVGRFLECATRAHGRST